MPGYTTPPGAIVNNIKSLLKERYKQGFPIIKEIVQNANDGGATRLDFGIVSGLGDKVKHPLLRTTALFFLNNGTFSKSDKEAITRFGIDANAKDKGKIGKFGLGQKSVFHFCEAFFYIARSSSIPKGCGEFINPWATPDGRDPKRPEWGELSGENREYLENYLLTNNLIALENVNYFLLWIPLRQKMIGERCILANYYDSATEIQESLPKDMETRIGQLLPLLRHLREIKYWLGDNTGKLQPGFHVGLDELSSPERCIYPDGSSETSEPNEHDLKGKINLSSDSSCIFFVGRESILSAQHFASLLSKNYKHNSKDFWIDLQISPHWSKRTSLNEDAQEETIPDKSIPHCAVVFTAKSSPFHPQSTLTIQWSVFLPLESEDNSLENNNSGAETYELIPSNGGINYTIFLHGYFFLDSGRKYIEGIKNIRRGSFVEKIPEKEDEMIAQWNYLLSTRGTLRLLLPSLQNFSQEANLSARDISNLCKAISGSMLFESEVYWQSICAEYQWAFCAHPTGNGWRLIPNSESLRSLPAIPPNWQEFSQLADIARQHHLIISEEPNLLQRGVSARWTEIELCTFIDSLNPATIFATVDYLDYLLKFLEEQKSIIKQSQAQASLINFLRLAFSKARISVLEREPLLSRVKKLVSMLNPEKKLKITKLMVVEEELNWVLPQLYGLKLDLFLVYQPFESSQQSAGVLKLQESISILSCLSNLLIGQPSRYRATCDLIQQFLHCTEHLELVLNQLENTGLFLVFNLYDGKHYVYNYYKIKQIHQNKLLFKNFSKSNQVIPKALQEALPNCHLIFITNELSQALGKTSSLKNIAACNINSCLELLATQPDLAKAAQRTDLLRELINYV
ncbi:MAG: hypothetical protein N5P05_002728 [Chroococcopsis gigantea SAG 12.99]|jgi:hypothetical protein|nr:hypothetical protein [Chroococcopsis gigantea SAG 12.99]